MELLLSLGGENISSIHNLLKNGSMCTLHMGKERLLECLHVLDIDPIAVSLNSNEERGNDLLRLIRHVLPLLEKLVKTNSTVELLLGGGIEIRSEFGEGGNLTVLGQLELHRTGNGFGGLVLSGGTDAGHGQTDGDGGTLSLVEEFRLQENLSVGNGNDVGRNVGGHITGLGLNDGEGGEGSSTNVAVHLGGTLEETGVEVEDISGVGLTPGGTTEEEGHLAVGHGLLGEIIVEDHGVLSVVAEEFSHSGSGVGSEELKRGGIGGSGGDDDAVVHGLLVIELSDELGDGGSLLSDSDVDTGQGVLLGLLVDNGVDGDGGLSGLTISNDQLTLSTADGDEGIDGLKPGEHGLRH
mmetsp:Transcript_27976/g.58799  ORF Transcript_27976/g.58799 Transcript_27976/m.58799 type:complete len:353 (-) Transcript_27976:577-1635(-)